MFNLINRFKYYKLLYDISKYKFSSFPRTDGLATVACREFPSYRITDCNESIAISIARNLLRDRAAQMYNGNEPLECPWWGKRKRITFRGMERWKSICSIHKSFNHTCDLCNNGHWVIEGD